MDDKFLEYAKENNIPSSKAFYSCWLHGYGFGLFRSARRLIDWAKDRKAAETKHRPDMNIYKKTLIQTWDQVIRKLGGTDGD